MQRRPCAGRRLLNVLFSHTSPTSSAAARTCCDRRPVKSPRGRCWQRALPMPATARRYFGGHNWRLHGLERQIRDLMSIGRARGIDLRIGVFLMGGGSHGPGLGGAHGHRIWHGRYRRTCCWSFLARLCLRVSKGSSGRGGRKAFEPSAGGERTAAQAAWPYESLVALFPEEEGGRPTLSG
jgi:hypothetical protein